MVKNVTLAAGGSITIRSDDAKIRPHFVSNLSNESRHFRFMGSIPALRQKMVSEFTQLDYEEHMALIVMAPTRASGTASPRQDAHRMRVGGQLQRLLRNR